MTSVDLDKFPVIFPFYSCEMKCDGNESRNGGAKIRKQLGDKVSLIPFIILLITGAAAESFCLPRKEDLLFMHYALLILVLTSISGLWTAVQKRNSGKLMQLVADFSFFLTSALVLPLFVAQVWHKHGGETPSLVHAFSGVLLMLLFLVRNCPLDLVDLVVGLNVLSLTYVAFRKSDSAALAACTLYGTGYCTSREGRQLAFFSSKEGFCCFLSGFVYCAMQSPALETYGARASCPPR